MVRYPSPSSSSSSSSNTDDNNNNPSSWREYKDQASTYFNQGNYHDALASYRAALNPTFHIPDAEKQIILSNIVCTRLKISTPTTMITAAIEEAKQCISLNPRWAKGHVRLASAYIALGGHSNDACNSLQRALQLDPGNKVARQMLLAELRRDREGRSEGFDGSGGRGGGDTVEPSAPPMEEYQSQQQQQQQHENDFVYNNGTNVNSSSSSSQPPPFNPDSFSSSTTPSAPPPTPTPNDYTGSPTTSPPTPPNNPYNNINNNDNIDESLSLSQRLQFHLVKFSTWYNETLSDDFKTLLKVILGLLVLYVAFGGRFGLDSVLGSENNRGNRGNYGVDNVYEKYKRGGGVGYNDGYNGGVGGGYKDRRASSTSYGGGYTSSSSSSSYSSSNNNNDDYIYSTPPRHRHHRSTTSSNSRTYHMPNLFDGSPASLLIILGIGFACHYFGINPLHVMMLLRMGNRRARGGRGYMGYGAMGGMGMGYGMANQIYRRHYGGGGAAAGGGMGRRR